jgi:hypothetical protein
MAAENYQMGHDMNEEASSDKPVAAMTDTLISALSKQDQVRKIVSEELHQDKSMRAYYVSFMGDFEPLKEFAVGLEGTAYIYEEKPRWVVPDGALNAIVVLPLGTILKAGEYLRNDGHTCHIIYGDSWITPP